MKITFCRCFYGGVLSCTDCGGNGIIIDYQTYDDDINPDIEKDTGKIYLEKLNTVLDNLNSNRYIDLNKIKLNIKKIHEDLIKNEKIKNSINLDQISIVYDKIKNFTYTERRAQNINQFFNGANLVDLILDERNDYYFFNSTFKIKSIYFKINIQHKNELVTVFIDVEKIIKLLHNLRNDSHVYNLHPNEIKTLITKEYLDNKQQLTGYIFSSNGNVYNNFNIYLYDCTDRISKRYSIEISEFYEFVIGLIPN
jgi:hypothetical protein